MKVNKGIGERKKAWNKRTIVLGVIIKACTDTSNDEEGSNTKVDKL